MAVPLVMNISVHEHRRTEVKLNLLLEGLLQLYEFDFRGYDRKLLAEKASQFAAQHALPSVSVLLTRILNDSALAYAFCHTLLEHERLLLGNPKELSTVHRIIESTLSSYPAPRLWIAECSQLEDVFAFAILLIEAALYERSSIYVTTSSESVLSALRCGTFPAQKMPFYEETLRQCGVALSLRRYVKIRGNDSIFTDELRSRIVWCHYNLRTDHPFNEFHLISCRAPFFRFTDDVRLRIISLFQNSLASYGVLHFSGILNTEEHMYLKGLNIFGQNRVVWQDA